jgi:large conductance mechanosensitive channel
MSPIPTPRDAAVKLAARAPLGKVRHVRSFMDEFRQFAFQGNIVDLGVGLVIGASFKELTSSFVDNILMPPIGLLLGNADFSQLFVSLNGAHFDTLSAAKEAGAPVLMYGAFLTQLIDFLLIALSVYVVLRFVLRQQVVKKK